VLKLGSQEKGRVREIVELPGIKKAILEM